MNAGISRGALSLVTTDPMDDDPDQQGQGPITGPDAIDTVVAGDDSGIAAARAALAASNKLRGIDSSQSALCASLTTSIYKALREDESFECLIERPDVGLELVHMLVAIRYYELTGELSKTEAENLRGKCEGCMLEAATAKKRKHKVTPRDMHAARKAAKTLTIEEKSHVSTHQLLSEAIEEGRRSSSFICLTETDVGFEERPILEAIFWAKRLGKINDNQAFTFFRRCLGSMSEAGVEPQAIEFIGIHAAGLFNSPEEARRVFKMMSLSSVEIGIFKEELDIILGKQTAPTQSGKDEPTYTIDWTPQPSRRGWFPEAFIIEQNTKKPPIPTGTIVFLQSREVRRTALEVVALAVILAIGGKAMNIANQENSPRIRWEEAQEPAAITATQPPDTDEPVSLGAITITVNPNVPTNAATKAPEVIITPPISVAAAPQPPQATPTAPQEQPSTTTPAMQPPETPQAQPTPQPQPAPQAQPTPPETVAQNTITLPVSTKPGTYGGVTLDESASKKLWQSAGYSVKARMGADGEKVFILSRDGKSFTITNTNVVAGQAEITAKLE